MKNLKRALSLVLATVMVIGMMVVGASAVSYNDFTDKDEISNAEAVALLNDMGIIEGFNGSYAPTATIDRAGMAKLITSIMMGNVDPATFEGTETDLTDINGHWAEGYIKYCYSNGIISGYAGKFAPNDPITVVGAAKLLLVALGYDAENRGYVGNNWSVNVMRDAATTREGATILTSGTVRALTAGVSARANDPLTRDDAAQMIFNALFVSTYTPTYQWDMGTQHINGYNYADSMAATMFRDLTRYTGVLTGIDTNGNAVVTPGVIAANKLAGTVADMGKVVAFYKDDNGFVSTSVVADTTNAAITVPGDLVAAPATSAKSVANWLKNNGLTLPRTAINKVVDYANSVITVTVSDLATIGNYAVAYVIDTNNDGVIDAYVNTTKAVSKVTGDTKTKTDSDGNVTVYVPGVTAGYKTVVGYEDLSKGDLVMHITYAGTTYITKCETVNGKITGYKGATTLYLNGEAYTRSAGAFGGQTIAQMYALDRTAKKDVTLFLDENGNVLYAQLVDTTTSYNVAVLLGLDVTPSSVDDTVVATARLLMADGSQKIVNVSDRDSIAAITVTLSTANKTYGTHYIPVAYSVDADGNYKLTNLSSPETLEGSVYTATELTDDTITPGVAKFSGDFTGIGTANTVFAVANFNASTTKFTGATVTTGIAKAPKFTADADGVVIDIDGVAALVFVVDGAAVDTSAVSNFAYIPSTVVPVYDSAAKTNTYVGAYVNGELTDLVVKGSVGALTTDTVIKVDLDENNVVIGSAAHGGVAKVGVAYADGVLTIATNSNQVDDYYTLDKDAKIYEIEDGEVREIAADGITADTTDAVIVLGASDMASTKVAKYVYITKRSVAQNSFDIQAYTEAGDQGSAVSVPTGTGATTATVTTGATVSVATDKVVGLTITATDGATVSVSGEQALVAGTASYDFNVTVTSENGARTQICTVTVTFTGVNA